MRVSLSLESIENVGNRKFGIILNILFLVVELLILMFTKINDKKFHFGLVQFTTVKSSSIVMLDTAIDVSVFFWHLSAMSVSRGVLQLDTRH